MLEHMKSMSSELTAFGWVDIVVADSASEAPELLFFRSDDDSEAVDGSLVVPGVAPTGDAGRAGAALLLIISAVAVDGALPSLTYSVVSSLRVA